MSDSPHGSPSPLEDAAATPDDVHARDDYATVKDLVTAAVLAERNAIAHILDQHAACNCGHLHGTHLDLCASLLVNRIRLEIGLPPQRPQPSDEPEGHPV